MTFETSEFSIHYENSINTIQFKGTLRMNDMSEYMKIKKYLMDIYSLDTIKLIIDFSGLDFMNSAGISTFLKFIFEAKDENKKPITIIGNKNFLWQVKSFENLKKIWNSIEIQFK